MTTALTNTQRIQSISFGKDVTVRVRGFYAGTPFDVNLAAKGAYAWDGLDSWELSISEPAEAMSTHWNRAFMAHLIQLTNNMLGSAEHVLEAAKRVLGKEATPVVLKDLIAMPEEDIHQDSLVSNLKRLVQEAPNP